MTDFNFGCLIENPSIFLSKENDKIKKIIRDTQTDKEIRVLIGRTKNYLIKKKRNKTFVNSRIIDRILEKDTDPRLLNHSDEQSISQSDPVQQNIYRLSDTLSSFKFEKLNSVSISRQLK